MTNNVLANNVGCKMKLLRKKKGVNQDALAEYLGISRGAISNYESGKRNPNIKDLAKIAKFYNVGLDYFGISQKDEVKDLLARATDLFNNNQITYEDKQGLYEDIMRLYLSIKKE